MNEFTKEEIDDIKLKIKELLNDSVAKDLITILEYLNYPKDKDASIMKIIVEMVNEYDLYKTRKDKYMLFKDSELAKEYYKGTFIESSSGYGFVNVLELSDDIFIPKDYKNTAMDGDLVFVHITKGETDTRKCEGKIIEILERNPKTKLAEVIIKDKKVYCILKNNKESLLTLQGEGIDKLVDGDIITIEFGNKIVKVKVRSFEVSTKKEDASNLYEFVSEEKKEL